MKLFRKSREERSIGYLLYAIGEIVLVVVGILIALQIDTWNTKRVNEIRKNNILSEIREQLKDDLEDIQVNIAGHESSINAGERVIAYLRGDTVGQDSVGYFLVSLTGDYTSLNNMTSFETLKDFGLQHIRQGVLRTEVARLYDYHYESLETLEEEYYPASYFEIYNDRIMDVVEPLLYYDEQDQLRFKSNVGNRILTPRIEYELRQASFWRTFQLREYNTVVDQIHLVDSLIGLEIGKR